MIADEYAKALFNIAKEENKEKEFDYALKVLNGLIGTNSELIPLMTSFMISNDEKKQILKDVLGDIDEFFYNFLFILIDNNRFSLFLDISNSYYKLLDIKNNVLNVIVQSPTSLTKKQLIKIKKAMEMRYPLKNIIIDNRIDESLIGGIKILCQNEELDISVIKQLNDLKNSLWKG